MEYLHPQLLSTEEIIRILNERELHIPNIESLNRNELIQIFNKFAVPLSQRNPNHKNRNVLQQNGQNRQFRMGATTNGVGFQQEQIVQKRILSPGLENDDCVSKLARITLTVNFNGTVQKRSFCHEGTDLINPKRQKISSSFDGECE